jgi:putative membrane protein
VILPEPNRLRGFSRRRVFLSFGLFAGVVGGLVLAGPLTAHGAGPLGPPTPLDFLLGWSFDPLLQVPLLGTALAYAWAVRRVDAAHPNNPVPASRLVCFLAGITAIEIALQSGIERYDDTLFSVHMVQHATLTMIAAPLLALGAPITLLLRVVRPEVRRSLVLPILHSRLLRAISFPVVSWLIFAGVMWGSHFSPLFEAALENDTIHNVEHLLFVGSALLFWWPVVGLDPSPWRMPHPVRALYAGLQMPQNTFLSLAIFSATAPLYEHYVALARTWGPDPLTDQQAAGAIMWVVGDLTFLFAILLVVRAWMRSEDRAAAAVDSRLAAQEAALREREGRLAARRIGAGDEASVEPQASGTGVSR